MKLTNEIKILLQDLLANNINIPQIYWNDILWLYSNRRLGMDRKGKFYVISQKGSRINSRSIGRNFRKRDYNVYTWNAFFLSNYFRNLDHAEIISTVQDINLLIKPGLKAKNIVNCKNQAIKRVLIDRFGFKKLINELHGTVINQYKKSKLIKIDIKENENLVVVKVVCPSTNDTYLLRVPPSMKNCQQAIAWTFGLNKEDYNPVKET